MSGGCTWPCRVFKSSSRFLGLASATGTSTGPSPIGRAVVSSKNCSRRLPASAGISSISCCSRALFDASVLCLLLGGGTTVDMIYLDPRITTVDIEGIDVWILESLRDEREILIFPGIFSALRTGHLRNYITPHSPYHFSSIFHFFSLVTS
jgi:hypothetical protein